VILADMRMLLTNAARTVAQPADGQGVERQVVSRRELQPMD
jgi:hypothetical protein